MQFALALGIAAAIGLGAYSVWRARKAEHRSHQAEADLDAFAMWFLTEYAVADDYMIEMELVEK